MGDAICLIGPCDGIRPGADLFRRIAHRNANARGFQHGEIVSVIAKRHRLCGRDAEMCGKLQQGGALAGGRAVDLQVEGKRLCDGQALDLAQRPFQPRFDARQMCIRDRPGDFYRSARQPFGQPAKETRRT